MQTILVLVHFLCLVSGIFAFPPLQIGDSSQYKNYGSHKPIPALYSGVRISQDLEPTHYDLNIRPIIHLPLEDPQQFTAPGEVTITLRAVVPTNNITLHASDIIIYDENVQLVNVETSLTVGISSVSNDSAMSTYTILLSTELTANSEYKLFIPYLARVGDRLSGLYRSSYEDETGAKRWLATTQFQFFGARMAFPCFDEPTFKSTFNITIGRYDGYNSLTNSPLLRTEPDPMLNNWYWDYHSTTVKMSTYAVAIIVSDFVWVEAPQSSSNYTVKIWGPPTITNQATAEFAAISSAQILSYFETYLESEFQFPKLDSAAIPDFEAQAMENWAINTYRVNLLLFTEGESNNNDKYAITRIMAHEIGHHWFGDLATCEWWNDLWLNEGFASYMEILGSASTGFDIDALDHYTIDMIQGSMAFDAEPYSQPLRSNNTDNYDSTPSVIIYQKGASLVRMMQGFLSEKTFIGAIRNYLDVHAYDNTEQDELFAELQIQADLDGALQNENITIKQIMEPWTSQTGFPIVSVTWFPDRVLFRHEKFSTNPPHWDETATQDAGTWYTPIAWTTGSAPDFSELSWKPKFWFEPGTQNTSRVLPLADDEWLIVNPDARSYIRTIYCPHFLSLIINQLETNHTVISTSSRGQIIDDLFKTVFSKGWENAQLKDALNITKYLHNEDSAAVWITVYRNLKPIISHLMDREIYPEFSAYVLSKVTPVLDRIGWEHDDNDSPKVLLLRFYLMDLACSLGSPTCASVAASYADKLANDINVPADLQPVIFCKAMSISDSLPGPSFMEKYLLAQYNATKKPERIALFINSLACIPELSVYIWIARVTSSSTPFTPDESIYFLERLARNAENVELIISYFLNNLNRIISVLGEEVIARVVAVMASYTSHIVPRTWIREIIVEALKVVTDENIRNSLIQSNSTLVSNIEWYTEWGQQIENWL